jgi:hypothetical protein
MRKRATIIFALLVVAIGAVLTAAYHTLSGPHGKLVARLQKKDAGGYVHSVTVRQFAGRFRTELSDEGRPIRDLPVSCYEFYQGSDPITAASITWPDLQRFTVSFNNGVTIECAWNETNYSWTRQ